MSQIPLTRHTQIYNKIENLDTYLDAIIFDRSITFSYKIRRFPVTLKPAGKHGLYLVLNITDKKFAKAESAYSVVENSGVNMEQIWSKQ